MLCEIETAIDAHTRSSAGRNVPACQLYGTCITSCSVPMKSINYSWNRACKRTRACLAQTQDKTSSTPSHFNPFANQASRYTWTAHTRSVGLWLGSCGMPTKRATHTWSLLELGCMHVNAYNTHTDVWCTQNSVHGIEVQHILHIYKHALKQLQRRV